MLRLHIYLIWITWNCTTNNVNCFFYLHTTIIEKLKFIMMLYSVHCLVVFWGGLCQLFLLWVFYFQFYFVPVFLISEHFSWSNFAF